MSYSTATSERKHSSIVESTLESFYSILETLAQAAIEVTYGWKAGLIPHHKTVLWALGFNFINILKIDRIIFESQYLHLKSLYPTGLIPYSVYCILVASLGYMAWGVRQAIIRRKVVRRLTETFQNSGLKSPMGKLPSYIFDRPLDEYLRKLRVTNAYLPLSQFKASREKMESGLQVFIDEIREDKAKGTIDINYSHFEMPTDVKFKDLETLKPGHFFVGQTRSRKVFCSLEQIPHILIGGQTGGGKSTFLRQFITSLYIRNSGYYFTLIDLKGGLEFQLFEGLRRVQVCDSTAMAHQTLEHLSRALDRRQKILKLNKCKDLTQYFELPEAERQSLPNDIEGLSQLDRQVVIIDEAAEIFTSGNGVNHQVVNESRRYAARLAALGRAVGIHLIIATQKPDVKAVDGQIKTNLTGMLSFPMANIPSSVSILNSARAADLPNIPGRAIWKSGLTLMEVQTPHLSMEVATESINKQLKKERNEKGNY